MSSILKALKKLEEEQSGRSAPAGGSGGQFVAPVRAGQPFLLLILGVGAGLLLAGGGFALFGRPDIQGVSSPAQSNQKVDAPADHAAPLVTAVVADRMNAPVASPGQMQQRPAVAASAKPSDSVAARIAAGYGSAAAERTPPSTTTEPVRTLPKAAAASGANQVENIEVQRREIPAPGRQWTAPLLAVSEILATSEGGRMAIVNGMPVMEGTMFEEALVEKIGDDHVVFVVEGKAVVVPLMQQSR